MTASYSTRSCAECWSTMTTPSGPGTRCRCRTPGGPAPRSPTVDSAGAVGHALGVRSIEEIDPVHAAAAARASAALVAYPARSPVAHGRRGDERTQRIPHRVLDHPLDPDAIAEPHLELGGMDVHVHVAGVRPPRSRAATAGRRDGWRSGSRPPPRAPGRDRGTAGHSRRAGCGVRSAARRPGAGRIRRSGRRPRRSSPAPASPRGRCPHTAGSRSSGSDPPGTMSRQLPSTWNSKPTPDAPARGSSAPRGPRGSRCETERRNFRRAGVLKKMAAHGERGAPLAAPSAYSIEPSRRRRSSRSAAPSPSEVTSVKRETDAMRGQRFAPEAEGGDTDEIGHAAASCWWRDDRARARRRRDPCRYRRRSPGPGSCRPARPRRARAGRPHRARSPPAPSRRKRAARRPRPRRSDRPRRQAGWRYGGAS